MLLASYSTGINDYSLEVFNALEAFNTLEGSNTREGSNTLEGESALEAYELPNHLLIFEFGIMGLALCFDWFKKQL